VTKSRPKSRRGGKIAPEKTVASLVVPRAWMRELGALAAKKDRSKSYLLRRALREFLDRAAHGEGVGEGEDD
jgi:predicted transcriptional regulator